jgi:hypothetical protein
MSKCLSSLDDTEQYCNNCYNEKNMDDATCIKSEKSDQPSYDKDYGDNIKQITHDCKIIWLK